MRGRPKSKAVTALSSREAVSGDKSGENLKSKGGAKPVEGSANSTEPPADPGAGQPAAWTSLPASDTAVSHKESDALPTGAEQKKKKWEGEDAAGSHAEPAGDPQSSAVPVETEKKKKKSSKVRHNISVLGLHTYGHCMLHLHQAMSTLIHQLICRVRLQQHQQLWQGSTTSC